MDDMQRLIMMLPGGKMDNFFGDGSDGVLDTSLPISSSYMSATVFNGGPDYKLIDGNKESYYISNELPVNSTRELFRINFKQDFMISNLTLKNIYADKDTEVYIYIKVLSNNQQWYDLQLSDGYGTYVKYNLDSTKRDIPIYFKYLSRYKYYKVVIRSTNGGKIYIGDIEFYTKEVVFENSPEKHSPLVIKQYERIKIAFDTKVYTHNPCQGLVLYSKGDVIIDGDLDMNFKAAAKRDGEAIPQILTKFNPSSSQGLESYLKLSTSLLTLRGGKGGNGGYGGGKVGGSYRCSGGVNYTNKGRINLGGFGAGGSGGAKNDFNGNSTQSGQRGGNILTPEDGGNEAFTANWRTLHTDSYRYMLRVGGDNNGQIPAGVGGASWGEIRQYASNATAKLGGSGPGGGGGGSSAGYSGGNGNNAGGFILIIAKGSIKINSSGRISANGGAGGRGHRGSNYDYSGAGGGGGAGGGVIALFYKESFFNKGILSVSGGLGGAGGIGSTEAGNFESGGAGTSGSVGTIYTQQI